MSLDLLPLDARVSDWWRSRRGPFNFALATVALLSWLVCQALVPADSPMEESCGLAATGTEAGPVMFYLVSLACANYFYWCVAVPHTPRRGAAFAALLGLSIAWMALPVLSHLWGAQ